MSVRRVGLHDDTHRTHARLFGRLDPSVQQHADTQGQVSLLAEKTNFLLYVVIENLKVIFIHQANEKMDEAIVKSFYGLYGITEIPKNIMPMCIQWLGNSSVATIPTLFDLVRRHQLPGFELGAGDLILFASVGAGMNINAVCYRCG